MASSNIHRVYIVEWCSSGEQKGLFHVTTLGEILRANMQVFTGTRAAKYNERWITVGAFYDEEEAHQWANKLRETQESGELPESSSDERLVPQPVENMIALAILKAMPYQDFLKTDYWQQVRKEVLRRARYRCQVCNADTELDVHHRSYNDRGNEREYDVIALCRDCHAKFHDKP